MVVPQLGTERLALRQWTDDDLYPFIAMNEDPEVMEYFPAPLRAEDSAVMMGRQQALVAAGGPALFAAEVWATREFIGFIGLAVPRFEAHFTPCVEIGWRLKRSAWGQGYATEGALAVLDHGFSTLGLSEIVSFTSVINERSQRVMERIGMHHDPSEDFAHPSMDDQHRLSRHVLYRLGRDEHAAAVTSDTGTKPAEQG